MNCSDLTGALEHLLRHYLSDVPTDDQLPSWYPSEEQLYNSTVVKDAVRVLEAHGVDCTQYKENVSE